MGSQGPGSVFAKTRSAYLWTRVLNAPFWGIFSTLLVILYKEMHATPLQITVMVALAPVSALLSTIWSVPVHGRRDRLVANLVLANTIKFVPFLFFPFIDNAWLLIACYGVYMLLLRGAVPAWMEVIKRNIDGSSREKIFQVGQIIDYLGGGIMPVFFGFILDSFEESWRWIFFGTSLVGIFSTFFLLKLSVEGEDEEPETSLKDSFSFAGRLLKRRPDFARFQLGFMLAGSALMMMHTYVPRFFVDVLHLSYTEMTTAAAFCKGIGVALASPFWARLFRQINIFGFYGIVALLAATFPLLLLSASWNLSFLYIAWVTYGIMQAGSELCWHMSGPVFAKNEDSAPYSSVNVLAVGVRGCFAPAIGGVLGALFSATGVIGVASGLCFTAALAFLKDLRQPAVSSPE